MTQANITDQNDVETPTVVAEPAASAQDAIERQRHVRNAAALRRARRIGSGSLRPDGPWAPDQDVVVALADALDPRNDYERLQGLLSQHDFRVVPVELEHEGVLPYWDYEGDDTDNDYIFVGERVSTSAAIDRAWRRSLLTTNTPVASAAVFLTRLREKGYALIRMAGRTVAPDPYVGVFNPPFDPISKPAPESVGIDDDDLDLNHHDLDSPVASHVSEVSPDAGPDPIADARRRQAEDFRRRAQARSALVTVLLTKNDTTDINVIDAAAALCVDPGVDVALVQQVLWSMINSAVIDVSDDGVMRLNQIWPDEFTPEQTRYLVAYLAARGRDITDAAALARRLDATSPASSQLRGIADRLDIQDALMSICLDHTEMQDFLRSLADTLEPAAKTGPSELNIPDVWSDGKISDEQAQLLVRVVDSFDEYSQIREEAEYLLRQHRTKLHLVKVEAEVVEVRSVDVGLLVRLRQLVGRSESDKARYVIVDAWIRHDLLVEPFDLTNDVVFWAKRVENVDHDGVSGVCIELFSKTDQYEVVIDPETIVGGVTL